MAMVETRTVPWQTLDGFMRGVFESRSMSTENARLLADTLTQANLRGVDTHGAGLLPNYYERLKGGGINPRPEIKVVKESPSALLIDADAGPGQIATIFAMRKAISKARETGIGWGQVFNSNHHGALAYYALMAANEGMLGITTTGTGPSIAPWGGKVAKIGNNPLAIAAPAKGRSPVVLDMACSVRAQGQLRLAAEKGTPLPEGLSLDRDGNPTQDAEQARTGSALPFGGYKGFGLTMMLELIGAVLSGARHTTQVPFGGDRDPIKSPREIGHMVAAINIAFFTDLERFKSEVAGIIDEFKATPLREGFTEVVVPGDPERRNEEERLRNGIPVHEGLYAKLKKISDDSGIPLGFS
jgi:ureidoglycolate dehydrogenase (NAD+)